MSFYIRLVHNDCIYSTPCNYTTFLLDIRNSYCVYIEIVISWNNLNTTPNYYILFINPTLKPVVNHGHLEKIATLLKTFCD